MNPLEIIQKYRQSRSGKQRKRQYRKPLPFSEPVNYHRVYTKYNGIEKKQVRYSAPAITAHIAI